MVSDGRIMSPSYPGFTPPSLPARCALVPVRHITSVLRYALSTTSTVILFGIRRVVMGENTTFVGKCSHNHLDFGLAIYPPISVCIGGEDFLISRGVELVNLDSTECKDLMAKFIQAKPEVWNEDIGEE